MPFPLLAVPLILKGVAVLAGAAGAGAAVKGVIDTKNANDTMKATISRHEENLDNFKKVETNATSTMEKLGKQQANVAKDFERFVNAFEKIHNKPDFSTMKLSAEITEFDFDGIKVSSVAAGVLLGAIAGGAAGAILGTAAATGLTAAVVALGTASTGTAIASLSGAAATKATLAILGGGTLAAGGGGVAAGTFALGAATLGVGFLVGGVIFAFTGSKIKEKANEACDSMLKNEEAMNRSVQYLSQITDAADKLCVAIETVHGVYDTHVSNLVQLVERETDWNAYSQYEQLLVENNILIVSILHKMINTPLLKVTETDEEGNPIKTDVDNDAVNSVIDSSMSALAENCIG